MLSPLLGAVRSQLVIKASTAWLSLLLGSFKMKWLCRGPFNQRTFRWFGTQTKVPSESIQVARANMKQSVFLGEKLCYQVKHFYIVVIWQDGTLKRRLKELIFKMKMYRTLLYFIWLKTWLHALSKRLHGYMQLMNTWMFSKRCCSRIRDCFTEWYSHSSGSKSALAWGLLHVIWRLLPVVKLFQYLSLLKLSLLCRHDTRQQFNSRFWRVCFNRNS